MPELLVPFAVWLRPRLNYEVDHGCTPVSLDNEYGVLWVWCFCNWCRTADLFKDLDRGFMEILNEYASRDHGMFGAEVGYNVDGDILPAWN